MKGIYWAVVFSFAIITPAFAQTKLHNVVFALTTRDPATRQGVIRWINSIIAGYPDPKIEVGFMEKFCP